MLKSFDVVPPGRPRHGKTDAEGASPSPELRTSSPPLDRAGSAPSRRRPGSKTTAGTRDQVARHPRLEHRCSLAVPKAPCPRPRKPRYVLTSYPDARRRDDPSGGQLSSPSGRQSGVASSPSTPRWADDSDLRPLTRGSRGEPSVKSKRARKLRAPARTGGVHTVGDTLRLEHSRRASGGASPYIVRRATLLLELRDRGGPALDVDLTPELFARWKSRLPVHLGRRPHLRPQLVYVTRPTTSA